MAASIAFPETPAIQQQFAFYTSNMERLGRACQACAERNLETFHMPVYNRQGPRPGVKGRRQRCRHVMLMSMLVIVLSGSSLSPSLERCIYMAGLSC